MIDEAGVFLRRAVDLRRYENGLARRVESVLRDVREDIVKQLAALDPNGVGTGYRERRLRALLAQVDETLRTGYREINTLTHRDLRDYAEVVGEQTRADLSRIIGETLRTVEVGATRLRAIVDTHPVDGFPLSKWWSQQRAGLRDAFERQIRLGMVQSETIDQLVRRVRGTSVGGGKYVGGIMETSTRHARTLVRTATNAVNSEAQRLTLEANKDVAPTYRYTATLDKRTSEICRALDGKEFPVDDESAPRPPMHPACRSSMVPVVDWKALGITPPKPGMRASKDGPVPADLDYDGWLRTQPKAVQDEVLGPSRAALWRDGKASLADMVNAEGRTLTLAELRARI